MASTRTDFSLAKMLGDVFSDDEHFEPSFPEEGNGTYYIEYNQDLSTVPVDAKSVVFPAVYNDFSYRDLLELPQSIVYLYLNHDGVIYGSGPNSDNGCQLVTKDDIMCLMRHLTKLKVLQVCGYCSDFAEDVNIDEIAAMYGVKIEFLY